jgi:hypothetical protein
MNDWKWVEHNVCGLTFAFVAIGVVAGSTLYYSSVYTKIMWLLKALALLQCFYMLQNVKSCFFLRMSTLFFFRNKNNLFLTYNFLNWNLPFISFVFLCFIVVFEQISFYFHLNHSDVRITQNVSFQFWNKLKIRPQKQIGFMHVDITNLEKLFLLRIG